MNLVMKRILVVEDQRIVGLDIQGKLEGLGYEVPSIVSRGEDVLETAKKTRPNLVLMDIRLEGKMDGIEAAVQLRHSLDVPVVYITAYADDDTLKRAKLTEPYGYLLKPFEERDLCITIEMALYKHSVERKLRESEIWLSTTLNSIGDAVIATDRKGYINFMNPAAERLTGWNKEDAVYKHINDILKITDEDTDKPVKGFVEAVFKGKTVLRLVENTLLFNRQDDAIAITASAAPISNEKGNILGAVFVIRNISGKKRAEEELRIRDWAMKSSISAIVLADLEGRLTYVNPSFLSMWGYKQREALGRSIVGLWQNRDRAMEMLNSLNDKGSFIGEITAQKKDTSLFDVQLIASIVKDRSNKPICMMASFVDITDRKRAI
ncbi:MAG TPA: PAS domain S-box protein, partial [Bacteroidetes bacterium]|nr:PAS domain S-box protein [Bacteroidota bacterium]